MSAGVPKQGEHAQEQKQAGKAPPPSPVAQPPPSQRGEERHGCPGTSQPKLSCEMVIAKASEAQANAAYGAVDAAWAGIWLGLVTACVAGLAAKFAKDAASAATKSYRAFVAAEDACLAIEFPNASFGESFEGGVRTSTTYNFTCVITNIGRSTARVHDCTVREHMVTVDKTLKPEDTETLGWSIPLESLDPFRMVVRYTSPIRTNAMLVVNAIPQETRGRSRYVAQVISTHIIDDY